MALGFAYKEHEVDSLLKEGKPEEALSRLQSWLIDVEESDEIGEIARKLAFAHFSLSGSENREKAFQYAFMAAEHFVKAGRAAPALALLIWMRDFQDAFDRFERLEKLVVQSFARKHPRRRKHADDSMPVPTPYQELTATVSFEDHSSSLTNPLERHNLKEVVNQSFLLLSNLKASEVARLLRYANILRKKAGETLYREGEKPEGFYILASGKLELRSSAGLEKTLEEGSFVGDISLFGHMNHSATATAGTDCELIYFAKPALEECFESIPRLGQEVLDLFYRRLFTNVAEHSLIFSILKPGDLERCWDRFVPVHVPAGRVIMEPNQNCDRFFLILQGKVEVRKFGRPCVFLGPGHFVGERGVVLETMRTATLTTVSDCQLLECDKWSFEEICEDFPEIPRSLRARRKQLEQIVFSSKNYVVD